MKSLDERIAERKKRAKEETDDGRYTTKVDNTAREMDEKWTKAHGDEGQDKSLSRSAKKDPTA